MQRWEADEPRRPWIRRQNRDHESDSTDDREVPPEVLDVIDMPDPGMGAHEVLVRVRASSVNPVDWKVREGMLRLLTGLQRPKALGADFAGVVERVGSEVEGFAVGGIEAGFE